MDASNISRENSLFGDKSQQWVSEWLEEKTGVVAISKPRSGIDVVCGDMNVEVKSISSLLTDSKSKDESRRRVGLRGFKLKHFYIKEETTHYAFVFYDEIFIPLPVILIIDAHKLHSYIREKKRSEWVYISIWWIKRNFDTTLSKFGDLISDR